MIGIGIHISRMMTWRKEGTARYFFFQKRSIWRTAACGVNLFAGEPTRYAMFATAKKDNPIGV